MTSGEPFSAKFKFESKILDEKKEFVQELPQPEAVDKFFGSFEEKRNRLMEFQKKYNFDFVNEVPLPEGRYEWYRVDSSNEDGDQDTETTVTKLTEAG